MKTQYETIATDLRKAGKCEDCGKPLPGGEGIGKHRRVKGAPYGVIAILLGQDCYDNYYR